MQICSDSATARRSDASSARFVVVEARRRPIVLVMVASVSVVTPAVVISLAAKRVFPRHVASATTRHWSALLKPRMRRANDSSA